MDTSTASKLEEAIACKKWIWAKTFASFSPRWYIVLDIRSTECKTFMSALEQYGKEVRFKNKFYTQFEFDGYRYWIVDGTTTLQKIINRALLDENKMKEIVESMQEGK